MLEAPLRLAIIPPLMMLARVLFFLEVAGQRFLPRNGPALVVSNHQGYLDPFFLQMGTARPIRFLATAEYYDIPLIRPFFRLVKAIRVKEGGPHRDALRMALRRLEEGEIVGLFPEGRLSPDGEIGEIRAGAGFLAKRGGVPVIPARIRGSFRVLSKRTRLRQAAVKIRFGPPLSPEEASSPERLRAAWDAL